MDPDDRLIRFYELLKNHGSKHPKQVMNKILIKLKRTNAFLYIRNMLCYIEPCDEVSETFSFQLNEN